MALEIERKFLVRSDGWKQQAVRQRTLRQAYLSKSHALSMRVRIEGNESATLTIKAAKQGFERHEFEYRIPVADAEALLAWRSGTVITKTRHIVPIDELIWEVDVYEGENRGLVIAEVELSKADQTVHRPAWLGDEVSHDGKYFNASLSVHPYSKWLRDPGDRE